VAVKVSSKFYMIYWSHKFRVLTFNRQRKECFLVASTLPAAVQLTEKQLFPVSCTAAGSVEATRKQNTLEKGKKTIHHGAFVVVSPAYQANETSMT
jgi:hypothetical protein